MLAAWRKAPEGFAALVKQTKTSTVNVPIAFLMSLVKSKGHLQMQAKLDRTAKAKAKAQEPVARMEIQDHYDTPMRLLDGDAEVTLVMADSDESPVATATVTDVRLGHYGVCERALWLNLGDGRKFAVVWSRPEWSQSKKVTL